MEISLRNLSIVIFIKQYLLYTYLCIRTYIIIIRIDDFLERSLKTCYSIITKH